MSWGSEASLPAEQKRMPSFICVGPPRTATSWLHLILSGHAGLPEGTKETHFFSRYYYKGRTWYESHFENCPDGLTLGEICTSYFASPEARQRISNDIPGCKIACTLREPVERLYSYYKLARHYGWARKRSFEEAFKKELRTPMISNYPLHIKGWREAVGKENVLVLLYDDLIAAPQDYLTTLYRFIGVAMPAASHAELTMRVNDVERSPRSWRLARLAGKLEFWLASQRRFAALERLKASALWRFCTDGGDPFPPLSPELRRRLQGLFSPLVAELEALLQRDLSAWKV
jgi:hypothetical protein